MRVRWTEPAARDLTHICDYIEEHDSTTTARRVAIFIYERVSALVS
jgi:plasmid stabilization system protein ParE